MARNWAESARKLRALRIADWALLPATLAVRARRRAPIGPAPKILVLEFWHIGDAVMAEPLLRAIRVRYPDSKISLLCKPAARALLEPSGVVDEFVVLDVPWTSFEGKYRWRRYRETKFFSALLALRRARFDVTVDARMDLRSNLMTFLIGAPRRIGFDLPGGRGLLTDRVADPGHGSHKVEDWLAMLIPLGAPPPVPSEPELVVSKALQKRVDVHIAQLGLGGRPIVGMHVSARQAVRRWPLERFSEVAAALRAEGLEVINFVDATAPLGEQVLQGIISLHVSIEELPAYLARCAAFVGNDTGPAHVAAAVGTPTVTIFGPGAHDWFRPYSSSARLVKVDAMPCRPCFDKCIHSTNLCLQQIGAAEVIAAIESLLEGSSGQRSDRVDAVGLTSEIGA